MTFISVPSIQFFSLVARKGPFCLLFAPSGPKGKHGKFSYGTLPRRNDATAAQSAPGYEYGVLKAKDAIGGQSPFWRTSENGRRPLGEY